MAVFAFEPNQRVQHYLKHIGATTVTVTFIIINIILKLMGTNHTLLNHSLTDTTTMFI